MSIQPFDFKGHEVRVILIGDEPHIVGRDACAALEIKNSRDALNRLDPEGVGNADILTAGGKQSMKVLSESALYELIFQSRVAAATEFKRWVTREVLPSIRKTGSYGAPALSDDELMARAVLAANTKILALESTNIEQSAQLEAAAPKVEYHDTYVADEDLIQFRTMANQLGIGEKKMREALSSHRWIYNDRTQRWSNKEKALVWESRWRCYSDKKKYFRLVAHHEAPRINGEVRQTLKVTPHGATAIAKALRKWGVIAPEQASLEVGQPDAA